MSIKGKKTIILNISQMDAMPTGLKNGWQATPPTLGDGFDLWHWLKVQRVSAIYCDVPGSPCLSKTGPVVGPSFQIFDSLLLG